MLFVRHEMAIGRFSGLSMPKTRIMYIENKSASLNGPARIGRVTFSKTGKSISYGERTFQSLKGSGFKANYFDTDTGEKFWISGPRKMAKIASMLKAPRRSKSTPTWRRNIGVTSGERALNEFHEHRRERAPKRDRLPFPYDDFDQCKRLIDRDIAISPYAAFAVLHEICRSGRGVPTSAARSLRPLFSEGRTIRPNLAQTCGEIAKLRLQMMLFEIDSVDSMGR
jgi:hypothetical protein